MDSMQFKKGLKYLFFSYLEKNLTIWGKLFHGRCCVELIYNLAFT